MLYTVRQLWSDSNGAFGLGFLIVCIAIARFIWVATKRISFERLF
jgi:hypothetical protein